MVNLGSRILPARVLGTMAVAGLLVPFAPGAAQAAPTAAATCRSVAMPVPAGSIFSSVNGGDSSGRYLVGAAESYGSSTGLLWVDGRLKPIDQSPLAPYVQVQFNAVNRRGVIVGERMIDESSFHTDAFVYRGGRFTLLPAPNPGDETHALAVNSRGDIVGDAFTASGWQPVEWQAARPGTVRVLSTPGGGGGFATGIDEDGTVVGYLTPWPPGTPYVWPARGAARALPFPAGDPGLVGGNAVAIRFGMVAGNVTDPATGADVPALWNLRTGRSTVWRGVQGGATSVNRWGTIGMAGGGVVYADGRVVPLTGAVNTISDRGAIAGATRLSAGYAVRWRGCR